MICPKCHSRQIYNVDEYETIFVCECGRYGDELDFKELKRTD